LRRGGRRRRGEELYTTFSIFRIMRVWVERLLTDKIKQKKGGRGGR